MKPLIIFKWCVQTNTENFSSVLLVPRDVILDGSHTSGVKVAFPHCRVLRSQEMLPWPNHEYDYYQTLHIFPAISASVVTAILRAVH